MTFANISTSTLDTMNETILTRDFFSSTSFPSNFGHSEALANSILSRMNDEEKFRQIPLAVFLTVLCMTGFLGNMLVCFIYGRVYKISNSRTFIICLAIVDLFTCVIGIPMELATSLDQYQFHDPWVCKISRFTNIFATITSAIVLVLIAMDRYRKICRSLEWQITSKHSKILCFASIIAGLVLSWPALLLYGIKSTKLVLSPTINGTSYECSIDDSVKNTSLPLVYEALHTLVFLVGVVSLVVLYILIGRRVRFFAHRHEARRASSSNGLDGTDDRNRTRKTRRQRLEKLQSECSSSEGESNASTETKSSTIKNSPLKQKISFTLSSGMGHNAVDMKPNGSSSMNSIKRNDSVNLNAPIVAKQAKCRKTLARNTTYLMFIISVVFILNFVPVLTLVLIRELKKDFVENMSDAERTAYRFFLRSYYISAAVNPVIYSIFDRRFRKAVSATMREICDKLTCCKQS